MSGLYADDKAAQIGVTLTLSILVLTDIIGNSLVIKIILTNKSLRSPMIYLLLNLAVADLMVGVFFSPLYIFSQFFSHPDGIVGTVVCKLLTGGYFAWIGGACSAATLVAISFERYFAVMHPYSKKYKLNGRKVKQVIAGCWTSAFVIIIPCFLALDYDKETHLCMQIWSKKWFGSAYSTLCFIYFGVIPITIMLVLYSRVIYTLWFKQNQEQGTQLAVLKSRKRVTKVVVIVSVIFAACWLPDSIIYLLYHYTDIEYNYSVDVPSICGIILVTCNSSINPFIYTFQSKVFRRHLIELVYCRKSRKNAFRYDNKRDSIYTSMKNPRSGINDETTNEHSM
ncbi:pyroglutamylated RF-amide peptide receptor-like [Actinia tenebrosa]|uniref:Pyroglutamylated RF-amide peptide receptor-like n=1 Tax=Actinia tenebrosa TaxID=6105 RepID=A0A6P8II59_ACTTE|nr:pyroglutamylated RF-amide peptide receptor-like [Actinia tenebrosa]XP_031566404.1 pyroglutamylated RF-amide peptide receptor-like [Actinia tenebrosa]XP_031566405.1 pyroglutamylated RF-amide peptide receptor-like [Actinia tenebrosa]